MYSKSAIVGIRAAIQRHLSLPPFSQTRNITTGDAFKGANLVLHGKLRELRKQGLDTTKAHLAIPAKDIATMYSSRALSNDNPTSLQLKVFFELSIYFGRKGREVLRDLKPQDILFKKDSGGKEYVTLAINPMEKNQKSLQINDISHDQRLYATGQRNCPLTSLKLYISKLHAGCSAFFQRPKVKNYKDQPCWYISNPVGVNSIGKFMERISEAALLQTKYTNHSIRVTTLTTLRNAGLKFPCTTCPPLGPV